MSVTANRDVGHGVPERALAARPRRRTAPAVGALAVAAFGLSLVVRGLLMPLGTGNADEGVYVYQAHLLQAGEVTLSASDHEPFFRPWLTGARDDRLFFQYGPGWPALLAASDSALRSTDVGVALVFAGLVVAVHALALEALGSRRTALVAAALATLTPMLVWQSATYLSYLFTTLLLTLALLCALRAIRPHGKVWAVGFGVTLGIALLTRPFDAALGAAVASVAVLLVGGRSSIRELLPRGVAASLALSPFVVLTLLYNRAVTGSFHRFPLMASDPLNRFGFGERRMQIGAPTVDYSPGVAWESLLDNVGGSVGWVFGGFLAVVLVASAVVPADRRAQRLTLAAMVALFPVGYFFWWATALSADTATNGIGPHYYVPAFVPLAILSADGLVRLSERWPVAALLAAAGMGVVTAYNLVDKVDDARGVTALYEDVAGALADDLTEALVFVRTPLATDFLLVQFPFLMNGPGLDDDVLFAVDRGAENGQLVLARDDRRAFLLHQQLWPGDELLAPTWGLTPLWSERDATISVEVSLPAQGGTVVLFAASDHHRLDVATIQPAESVGTYRIGLAAGTGCAREPDALCLAPGSDTVVVGVERDDTGERWERHYEVLVEASGSYVVNGPGTGRMATDFGNGPVTLRAEVSHVIADVRGT